MMKQACLRFIALALSLSLALSAAGTAFAATATPTPPPRETVTRVLEDEVPEKIQQLLDLAYSEWETLDGKALSKVNKYTEWRGKGIGFGWCGGFITWCMLQLDFPMERLANMKEEPKEGIFHVKEASVGKLLRGYQKMGRSTNVPQKGFLLVYAVRKSANKTTHIGLVYDVQELGNGKYRITTIEGNMSSRVKMYVHDYDMYAEDRTRNLSAIPEEDRTRKEDNTFNYKLQMDTWYVNCFLMPWIPEDYLPATPTPAPTPTPTPTPLPTPEPTPMAEFSIFDVAQDDTLIFSEEEDLP